jgi:hypothetical protein
MSSRNRWILVAGFAVAIVGGVLIVGGCKKKEPESAKGKTIIVPVPGENLIRLHWLGKKAISGETNSAAFMQIWNLPTSLAVQSRFLDQVSLAPWRLLPGNTNYALTNATSALLRPLLDDLIENEVYFQVTKATNQAPELAIAIKIDEARAASWKANLPAVWNSFAAGLTKDDKTWPNGKLELRRSGEWMLAGIGGEGNPLLVSLESVVRANARPPGSSGRLWLEGDVALSKIVSSPAWLITGVPNLEIALSGNPQGVSTKAVMNFAQNLPFEVEPWKVPTNLIHGPIHGFAAAQGFSFLLASNQVLKALLGELPPNQLFTWSQTPHPSYVFAALPSEQASNTVSRMADFLTTAGNPWLTKNASGRFERMGTGVFSTAGSPMMGPFMDLAHDAAGDYILAGFGRNDLTNQAAPAWLVGELAGQTNVVFYEREITGGRVPSWLFLSQALRVIFWKAQLPPDSLEARWFTNAPPNLGNLLTIVAKTGPNQLTLNRSSSVGLNSMELHLLADWMESDDFPRGIHTTIAKGMIRPRSFRSTNAPPGSTTVTNR